MKILNVYHAPRRFMSGMHIFTYPERTPMHVTRLCLTRSQFLPPNDMIDGRTLSPFLVSQLLSITKYNSAPMPFLSSHLLPPSTLIFEQSSYS